MNKKHPVLGIYITEEPSLTANLYGIDPKLAKQFEPLRKKIYNPENKKILDELILLIEKYPDAPMLKNYLSVAYSKRGMNEKAYEVNNLLVAQHPGYLFGKLNLANQCADDEKYELIPEILGEDMDIKSLFPDRDTFHVGEVTAFLKIQVRYYIGIDDLENAEKKLALMKEIAPDHQNTKDATQLYFTNLIKGMSEGLMKEREKLITPAIRRKIEKKGDNEAPVFYHPEINWLYQDDLRIPEEKLRIILGLPRPTLIADLEIVLEDAVLRYGFLSEQEDEKLSSSLLHAVFLLAELESVESLPKILDLLESDDKFLEFWFGDHLTSTLWQVVYLLGNSRLGMLKDFLLKPGIYSFAKAAVSEGLCQIALHQPEKRDEIEAVYAEVFTLFSSATLDENLIDSEFLGLAVGDCIDCGLKGLLPVIKDLHDKDLVDQSVNGSYENVEKYFRKPPKHWVRLEVRSIFGLYANILNTWAGYTKESEEPEIPEKPVYGQVRPEQRIVPVKTGRNDPCPCGSGKKYKKCCGK